MMQSVDKFDFSLPFTGWCVNLGKILTRDGQKQYHALKFNNRVVRKLQARQFIEIGIA